MPNTIALAKNYTALLDEVYRKASVTADLTSDTSMMRAGANANEILYPQIDVTGLGDYSRNSGYTGGAVMLYGKRPRSTMTAEQKFRLTPWMIRRRLTLPLAWPVEPCSVIK